ncbi:recombinase family protein, partial [Pseudorhodobacter sp. W20_MBD10_FR17]
AAAKKDHSKLIDAIIAGVPADQVKDRMIALDAQRIQLEAQLSKEPAPSPIRIHPKMAETYRDQVGLLIAQLQQPDGMLEAKEALRGLIDRIVLKPQPEGGKLSLHLEGALGALLLLSTGSKTQKGLSDKTQAVEYIDELVLVAGARLHKYLPLYDACN